MGTWGTGNLESDSANDYLLYEIMEPLEAQILSVLTDDAAAEADEDGDSTVVAVDALAALCVHFGKTTHLQKAQLEAIQRRYFEVWSPSMDGLSPVEGHKAERQAVIQATFARLLEHCR